MSNNYKGVRQESNLDNVDFAVVRPVRTKFPDSWPGTVEKNKTSAAGSGKVSSKMNDLPAALRHMTEIDDYDMGVPLLTGLEPHAVPTRSS